MEGNMQERERYSPLVLTETESLSREQWLEYRRLGIGGSDVAAIIGISPFRTARDVYYDKLGIAAVEVSCTVINKSCDGIIIVDKLQAVGLF